MHAIAVTQKITIKLKYEGRDRVELIRIGNVSTPYSYILIRPLLFRELDLSSIVSSLCHLLEASLASAAPLRVLRCFSRSYSFLFFSFFVILPISFPFYIISHTTTFPISFQSFDFLFS